MKWWMDILRGVYGQGPQGLCQKRVEMQIKSYFRKIRIDEVFVPCTLRLAAASQGDDGFKSDIFRF